MPVLNRTKQWLRKNDFEYKKAYIRPMMVPEHVYVLKFGRADHINSRVIVKYQHSFFGRLNVKELDLRLHGQHNPRIFASEDDLLDYLENHLEKINLDAYKHPERMSDAQPN